MELLERAEHLETLRGLLDETGRGAGRLVFVAGEAGAGKSALVQSFTDVAATSARVMQGACDPLATPRPLGPLVDAAPTLGEPVTTLLASGARHGLFEATLTALSGAPMPSVLVVEDAQWADDATLDLLRFLGRRVGGAAAMVVVTYRDDAIDARHPFRIALGDLASQPAVRRVDVGALSHAAVARLCNGSGIDAAALHARTGGNAFFVTEVIASGAQGVPPAVSDAVLARAARLSPSARVVLDAAAVIGPRIEPALLLDVAGIDALAVDDCITAGMLRFVPPAFVFRHELARQAILGAIPAYHRRDLHAQVLARLRKSATDPDLLPRLAEHAEEAGDASAVLEYAPAAAQRAVQLRAHREAEAQLARALRFSDAAPQEMRAELLGRHMQEAFLIDHLDDAVLSGAAALELWQALDRPLRAGDILRRFSRVHWYRGDNPSSERAGREALSVLEALPPSPELAMALANMSSIAMLAGDGEGTCSWGQRAINLARRLGDNASLVNALNNVGVARMRAGDQTGAEMLEESVHLSLDAGLEEDVARGWNNLASVLEEQLEFASARRYLEQEIAYCEEHDLYASAYCARGGLVRFDYLEGRWAEADAVAASMLEQRQMARISRVSALVVRARIAARRGDAAAWAWLDEALDISAATDLSMRALVVAAHAEALWLNGRRGEVEKAVRPTFESTVAVDDAGSDAWYVGELGFWLWRAGALEPPLRGAIEPYALQIAGDWRGAAQIWQRIGCPYEAAVALLDGDEAAAREALVEFERLGARPAAADASRRLRALGAHGVPRGRRPSTAADADGLTAREQEILTLLGDDMTNAQIASRLFLSERTVAHHVSAILGKLGVRTRAQAVGQRRARQLAGSR